MLNAHSIPSRGAILNGPELTVFSHLQPVHHTVPDNTPALRRSATVQAIKKETSLLHRPITLEVVRLEERSGVAGRSTNASPPFCIISCLTISAVGRSQLETSTGTKTGSSSPFEEQLRPIPVPDCFQRVCGEAAASAQSRTAHQTPPRARLLVGSGPVTIAARRRSLARPRPRPGRRCRPPPALRTAVTPVYGRGEGAQRASRGIDRQRGSRERARGATWGQTVDTAGQTCPQADIMITCCAACDKPILDKFLMNVLERTWHADCVRCFDCHVNLTDKCFSREGKLFCRDDFFR